MKRCPLCNNEIKNGDVVVALMLATYKHLSEGQYELQVSSQTISSHLFCIEKPAVVDTQKVEEPK